ncbi:CHY zinc finger protein [uncultured Corynebacterium sp.]|uniref:CHY zinc finger protein n=1 Tax=uncultured Corynebacterium sp. TaxID=159447 RepID=UPI0025D91F74|nr:CHY zinc finger protein [uncultured Corynebacterium sp.]
MMIHGAIDGEGRCAHWHSELDVVANRCATCGEWFACSLCHPADHAFGPMPLDQPAAMCGACGHTMTYAEYGRACPQCGHAFNPGCALHAEIYFQV